MATTSDIKRLKHELRTIWDAIAQSLAEKNPGISKRQLRELTRTRFLAVVDESVREIAAESP